MYRRDQFSERQQQQQLGTNPSETLLLLRCKTTIDELQLEVEKTEEEKCQIQRKFERLLKEFQDKEREVDDGKAFTQGIIEELNRCKSDCESLKQSDEQSRQENEQLRYSCSQIMEQNEELRQFSEQFKLERDQVAEDLNEKNNKLADNQEYERTLQEKIQIQEKMIAEYRVELESREQEGSITRRQVSNSQKRGLSGTAGVSTSNLRTINHAEQKIFDLQQHIETLEQHIQRQDVLIKKLHTQTNQKSNKSEEVEEGNKGNTEKDQLIKHQGQIIEKQAEQVKSVEKQLEDANDKLKTAKSEYAEVYSQIQSILTENDVAVKARDDANSALKAEIAVLKRQIKDLESQVVQINSEFHNQITYPHTARSTFENMREISHTIQGIQQNQEIKKNRLGLISLIEEQKNSKNQQQQLSQIFPKEQAGKKDIAEHQISKVNTVNDEFLSANTKQTELLSSPTDNYPSHLHKNLIGKITHKTPITEGNQNAQMDDTERRIQQQSSSQQLTSQQLNYSHSTDSAEEKYEEYPRPAGSFQNNRSLKEEQGNMKSPFISMAKSNLSQTINSHKSNHIDNKENTATISQNLPTEQTTVRLKSEIASQRIPTAKKQRLSAVLTNNSSAVCKNTETNRNSFHDGQTNTRELNKNCSQNDLKHKHGYILQKDNQILGITERKRAESHSKASYQQTQSSRGFDGANKERLVSKEKLKKQLESLEKELKLKSVENQLLKQGLSSSNLTGKQPSRKIRAITSISYN